MPLKGERVFLTGLTGFVGSHLGKRLLQEGAKVFVLLRRGADLWRVKGFQKDIVHVVGDLREADGLRRALREIKPEVIIHLGALVDVSRSIDLVEEMVEVNVRGTVNLIRGLKNLEFRCFINTGASEEYGDGSAPFREDQVPVPVSPYSASKVSATAICQMLHKGLGLPMVTLRPFLTFGPFQTNDMLIPYTIRRALMGETIRMTRGEQTRDCVYVDDIVEGYVLAAQKKEAIGEVINLGTGREYTVKDIVSMIMTMTKSRSRVDLGALPYRPGEAMRFFCDRSKAEGLLGWVPKVDLREGLKKTIEWFREYLEEESQRGRRRYGH